MYVDLEKYSPRVYPGNERAWNVTGPPENPADLLPRRFTGGEWEKG